MDLIIKNKIVLEHPRLKVNLILIFQDYNKYLTLTKKKIIIIIIINKNQDVNDKSSNINIY